MFYLAKRFALLYPEGDAGTAGGGGSGDTATGASATASGEGGNAATGASSGESHNSAPDWRESIADADLKKFATDRGFKDVGEVAKALRDAETKFTAPAKPEDYALGDGDFAKAAAGWFHEAGVPPEMAKALTAKWNAHVEQANAAEAASRQAAGDAELAKLKTEWGDGYDKNLELGRQAMRKFGVSAEVIDRLSGATGDAQTIKVFSAIGAAMSEGTLNPGGAGGSGAALTQEERAAKFYSSSQR